jgi:AbrB family looped-hinge helix DNA binding protein
MIDRGGGMSTVTISSKFQVVIPKAVRDQLDLQPGQKVQAVALDNRIELILVRPMREMRGFLSGIETHVEREGDRV